MLEYNQQEVSLRIGRARGYEAEKHNERKRGMMKKIVSALAALAVAGGMCMPAFAAKKVETTNIPLTGYEFVDIAYDGKDTLVAMAKLADGYKYGRLYYSTDQGDTWSQATDLNLGGDSTLFTDGNPIAANPQSQQQLSYWDDKNIFVVHTAKTALASNDGKKWNPNTNISWSSNAMTMVSGDALIMAANAAQSITNTAEKKVFDNYKNSNTPINPAVAIGSTLPNNEGSRYVFVIGNSKCYSVELYQDGAGSYKWRNGNSNSGNVPSNIYDVVYNEKTKEFLFVGGTKLYVADDRNADGKYDQYVKNYSVGNANVTGVNVNDRYIVLGMSDGTMYYTDNAAIDETTEWTQVLEMKANGPVKNIEFISDDEFVALSETGIYKGRLVDDKPKPVEPVTATPLDNNFDDGSQGWTAEVTAADTATSASWIITNDKNETATVAADIPTFEGTTVKVGLVLTKTAVGDNKISSVAFELK